MRMHVAGLTVLALVLAACGEQAQITDPDLQPLFAATTSTINDRIPLDFAAFVPCAAGGAGEFVLLSGDLHVLIHVTTNDQGGFLVKTHFQPQGVSGFGQTTGAKYQGTGVTQDITTVNAGTTSTFINNFRVIGQGRGNNFLVHQNVHLTVNANGEATATVDNLTTECK